MIPIRLSIEGLYSYQKKQDINFEYLTSAELFGIFGATGSGKSSILEAIGFALYGKTERLNEKEPGGTAYHMMNLKSNHLVIDFEFRAGVGNATRYRFRVENKRNSKHYEKTGSFSRSAQIWKDGLWTPIEESAGEEVVGLSYDNFKRCIIIPQGKFEEFLQLKTSKRTEMLKDLFGLEKYDLGKSLTRLRQQNQLQVENIKGTYLTFQAVTEEAMAANQEAISELESSRRALEITLQERQRAFEATVQLRELFENLHNQRSRLTQMEALRPAHDTRKLQLDRYQLAQANFAAVLSDFDKISRTLQETDKAIASKKDSSERIKEELEAKRRTFELTDQVFQTRDQLLRQAEELEKVIELQRLAKVIADRQERVNKGKKDVSNQEIALRDLSNSLEEIDKTLQTLEQRRPQHSLLMEVNTWFQTQQNLSEKAATQEKVAEKILTKIERGKEEKVKLARKIGIDLSQHDLPLVRLIEQVTQQQIDLETRKTLLDKQRIQEELQQRLHELAGDLKPGDPCPLCGSKDHPSARLQEDANGLLSQIRLDIQAVDRHLRETHQHLPSLRTLMDEGRSLAHELREAEATKKEISASLDLHQSRFIWSEYAQDGQSKIERQIREGEELERLISLRKQERQTLQDNLRRTQETLQAYRPVLDQLLQELNQLQGAFHTQSISFSSIRYADYETKAPTEVQQIINRLKGEYEGIVALHKSLSKEIEERNSRLHSLGGEIATLQSQLKDHTTDLARRSQKLDSLLEQSPFSNKEEVRQTLALALDIEAEKDEIRRYEREETQVQTSIRDLELMVKDRTFEAEAFEKLQAEIQELTQSQRRLTQEIGGKHVLAKRMETDFAEKVKLAAQLSALAQRAENIAILDSLFRGNGFVNYVSTVYLQNLCSAANERFLKLTGNALSLEIDAENNFLLRDYLNGGRTRSVKTLSGGQSFQAALCLALALSDQVQRQAETDQNFFFLDEGFGSQDKQSLNTIFRTLKSLRQENRIVGVISHVEELQQEIDMHLRIVNDPELGSKVYESWR